MPPVASAVRPFWSTRMRQASWSGTSREPARQSHRRMAKTPCQPFLHPCPFRPGGGTAVGCQMGGGLQRALYHRPYRGDANPRRSSRRDEGFGSLGITALTGGAGSGEFPAIPCNAGKKIRRSELSYWKGANFSKPTGIAAGNFFSRAGKSISVSGNSQGNRPCRSIEPSTHTGLNPIYDAPARSQPATAASGARRGHLSRGPGVAHS